MQPLPNRSETPEEDLILPTTNKSLQTEIATGHLFFQKVLLPITFIS